MEEFKFKSLNELFNRLYPAFNAKVNELKNENILVTEIILWNYLKENIWSTKSSRKVTLKVLKNRNGRITDVKDITFYAKYNYMRFKD